jgi:competence protein ComEC
MATSVVLPYLRSLGINSLDTLIISHPDNDHSAGAQTLLRALPVRRLLTSQPLPGEERGERCTSGQAWEWPGGPRFRFLSPALEFGLSSNDGSCVLQVDTGDHRLLLPGDIEHERERELVRYWRGALRADWLLLAHHGSRTSSTAALIKTVQPQWAVVTSGYANRFGHPHENVLQRVRRSGARLYNTAQQGALEFDFRPGEPPQISTHRARRQRYWM